VPAEYYNTGDTCAICIDTLEDDDEVRGLTCGHAFHAACIDPWLTTRRASCPLCKADYHVPKPRPPEAQAPARSAAVPAPSTTLARFQAIFRPPSLRQQPAAASQPAPTEEETRAPGPPRSRRRRLIQRVAFWRRPQVDNNTAAVVV
jgi:predicted component of type VI protein secretion system